jgi:hypothetical protein
VSRPTYRTPSAPAFRGEIEQALHGRGGIRIAATAKYLATQLGAPVNILLGHLQAMVLDGTLTTRRLRSGETLYKMIDSHHQQWSALAGPGARTTRATA